MYDTVASSLVHRKHFVLTVTFVSLASNILALIVFRRVDTQLATSGDPFRQGGGPQEKLLTKELWKNHSRVWSRLCRGVECALNGMKAGEVRQVVVPFGTLLSS
jgi:hypothetical protein